MPMRFRISRHNRRPSRPSTGMGASPYQIAGVRISKFAPTWTVIAAALFVFLTLPLLMDFVTKLESRQQDRLYSLARRNRTETEGAAADEAQAIGPCPIERFGASFWTIEATGSRWAYNIHPRQAMSTPVRRACLSQAIFSAAIVAPSPSSSNSTDIPPFILGLPAPIPNNKDPGTYNLLIKPEQLALVPSFIRTLELRVRLSFGDLPGGRHGNVCGSASLVCDPAETYAEQPELAYDGGLVQSVYGEPMKIPLKHGISLTRGEDEDRDYIMPCEGSMDWTKGEGIWLDSQWHPVERDSGEPCQLTETPGPGAPLDISTVPVGVPHVKVRWLAFYGDSNLRNLFAMFAAQFGSGVALAHHVAEDGERAGRKVAVGIIRYEGGSGATAEDPVRLVALTWRWWHVGVSTSDWDHASERLAFWTHLDLHKLLVKTKIKKVLTFEALRDVDIEAMKVLPERVYVSLGSHSQTVSSFGQRTVLKTMQTAMSKRGKNVARMGDVVQPILADGSPLRIFTTTGVLPSAIPFDQWPRQDIVRNNAVIRARNEVLKKHSVLGKYVMDIAEPTIAAIDGAHDKAMRLNETGTIDPLHFQDFIYESWAKMIWTELSE